MKKTLSIILCLMLVSMLSAFRLPIGKGIKAETPKGYKLIVSNPEKKVYVYGKLVDNLPYYNQVLVKTPGGEKTYNWKASERDPILIVQDISESGKAQVIIIFVTAFGTGAYESQIHVLDKSFGEIPVENPVDVVKANVKASIIGQDVVFRTGDKEFVVKPVGGILSPEEALRNLEYGSQVTFSVKDNKLASGVSAQISPNSILGQFVLEYNYINNRFVPKIVDFQAY
jgi:hypothetical protein